LIPIEIGLNNAVHDSSGYSPFFLTLGQHPHFPLSLAAGADKWPIANELNESKNGSGNGNENQEAETEEKEQLAGESSAGLRPRRPRLLNEDAKEFAMRMSKYEEEAKRNLLAAQNEQKRQADKHRREISFKVGDKAMLETKGLSKFANKLRARFLGPFTVKRVLSDVSMELDLPPVMEIERVIHVSKLKRYEEEKPGRFPTRVQINRPLAAIGKRQAAEYEMDRIVAERQGADANGKDKEYLVLWKGWPVSDATWEPRDMVEETEALDDWFRLRERMGEELSDEEKAERVPAKAKRRSRAKPGARRRKTSSAAAGATQSAAKSSDETVPQQQKSSAQPNKTGEKSSQERTGPATRQWRRAASQQPKEKTEEIKGGESAAGAGSAAGSVASKAGVAAMLTKTEEKTGEWRLAEADEPDKEKEEEWLAAPSRRRRRQRKGKEIRKEMKGVNK